MPWCSLLILLSESCYYFQSIPQSDLFKNSGGYRHRYKLVSKQLAIECNKIQKQTNR